MLGKFQKSWRNSVLLQYHTIPNGKLDREHFDYGHQPLAKVFTVLDPPAGQLCTLHGLRAHQLLTPTLGLAPFERFNLMLSSSLYLTYLDLLWELHASHVGIQNSFQIRFAAWRHWLSGFSKWFPGMWACLPALRVWLRGFCAS